MRNFIVTFCVSIVLIILPPAVYANETVENQNEEKSEKGLVRGLLHQVKDTVDKTLKSTGELVEETVTFTGETVERTVNHTTDTVKIVVDPKQEKPLKAVIENTTDFVGETVEKTVPVVEQATNTVQTVTNETVKVTKPLPKVPVVTPVVDKATDTVNGVTEQVKQTVDETVGTVTETVSKPLKKKTVQKQPAAEEETSSPKPSRDPSWPSPEKPVVDPVTRPSQPTGSEKPAIGEKPASPGEVADPSAGKRPVTSKPETEVDNVESRPLKAEGSTAGNKSVTDNDREIGQVNLFVTQGTEPIEENFTMESETSAGNGQQQDSSEENESSTTLSNPAFPLKPASERSWISKVQLITGSSSISGPSSSASTGMNGFGAVLADDWLMKAKIVQQKWYLEDIIGALQWSHSPPGQPPQSTPFLYVM